MKTIYTYSTYEKCIMKIIKQMNKIADSFVYFVFQEKESVLFHSMLMT